MATNEDTNVRSGSTTWEFRKVKIREPRPEAQHGSAKPRRFALLPKRDRRSRLTITLAYKGGAEAWWVIEARGRTAAFPGHRALHDVMAEINRDGFLPERH
jgi:hypothetical protein